MDQELEIQKPSKNRRRRRKKKDPAASVVVSAPKRWFSMYDVFRCKQLHLQLSSTVVDSTTSLKPDDPHKPLINSKLTADDQAQPRTENLSLNNTKKMMLTMIPRTEDAGDESQSEHDNEKRRRKDSEMQRRMDMVRRLQTTEAEVQLAAAGEIRAAARRDGEARTTLALMGAIPPLVNMLDSLSASCSSAALVALLNLAVRNDPNKAAIVSAGAVPKIVKLMIHHPAATAALLSLSALDSNKPAIAKCDGAPAALVAAVHRGTAGDPPRRDAAAALFNLSLCPSNAPLLCAAATVPAVLRAVYDPDLTPRAVATAANLAATLAGRRALVREEEAALVFLDVLTWSRCGGHDSNHGGHVDSAVYVVMVLAQCSAAQRRAMVRAGCSSVLLEIVLVGSPVAQERASRTLQFLDEDSATNSYCSLLLQEDDQIADDDEQQQQQQRERIEHEIYSEERRAVNRLVQQSLRMNMERITKRACIPFVSPS